MKSKRLDIYVGLTDRKHNRLENVKTIRNEFSSYFTDERIDFTITDLIGGYVLENGEYMVEDSIKISVDGISDKEIIKEFTDEVKKILDQESVLVDLTDIELEYY